MQYQLHHFVCLGANQGLRALHGCAEENCSCAPLPLAQPGLLLSAAGGRVWGEGAGGAGGHPDRLNNTYVSVPLKPLKT